MAEHKSLGITDILVRTSQLIPGAYPAGLGEVAIVDLLLEQFTQLGVGTQLHLAPRDGLHLLVDQQLDVVLGDVLRLLLHRVQELFLRLALVQDQLQVGAEGQDEAGAKHAVLEHVEVVGSQGFRVVEQAQRRVQRPQGFRVAEGELTDDVSGKKGMKIIRTVFHEYFLKAN